MKNLGIIILVLALLALGAYYFLSQREEAAPPEETTQEETAQQEEEPMGDPVFHALVIYANDGFEPQTVTIKKGETVRFVNNSDRDVWVASAIHPTHSIYPEKSEDDCLGSSFDTCRGLQAAEFWEFTFNETGSWKYHDHLKASETGTIVVE